MAFGILKKLFGTQMEVPDARRVLREVSVALRRYFTNQNVEATRRFPWLKQYQDPPVADAYSHDAVTPRREGLLSFPGFTGGGAGQQIGGGFFVRWSGFLASMVPKRRPC